MLEDLLDLARESIMNVFLGKGLPWEKAKKFSERRGVFVTLEKGGHLRGCIGFVVPVKPLGEAVVESAVSAAFRDPRFPPLRFEELPDVEIEVSVLSPLERVEFSSPEELLEKLEVGVHGVYLKKGLYSATFLPQVWELIKEKEEFMRQLALKAGLGPDDWKDAEVYLYTVKSLKRRFFEGAEKDK